MASRRPNWLREPHRDPDAEKDHRDEQRQQRDGAQESEFFADHREDEIGLLLGKEIKPALRFPSGSPCR